MRKYTVPQSMSVEYLLGDHLGSTSITTDSTGAKVSEMRYKPWGEVRYSWTATQSTTPAYSLTDYTFTGQFSYMDDPSTTSVTEGFGLMFYNARWYDPALGRFAQADSIIPGGVQGLDRYAYVNNNPIRYTDPTGHMLDGNEGGGGDGDTCNIFAEDCGTTLDTGNNSGGGNNGGGNNGNSGNNNGGDSNSGGSTCNVFISGCGTSLNAGNSGGGGHPLSSLDPKPNQQQGPQWCNITDCVLSAIGFLTSAFTWVPFPVGEIASGVDFVVTIWSVGRTNYDYRQGKISKTRQYFLNGTGLVGLLPFWLGPESGFIGAGASFFNLLMTATGLPN